ncbi:MAG: hypothetical protein K2W95_25180 [Candidatus Obscuribacterales bacterium]|nr:hypothetical protein [Candidatus Obscuribacterales bacterium]
MKIVISRKGFDSGSGGVPSPILPDGRLVPLPIPCAGDPHEYADVMVNGVRIDKLVEDLTGGRLKGSDRCHLDPDIDAASVRRRPSGWGPAFGQIGAAQSHLARHGIGSGDLFLFFGWFRPVEQTARMRWQYVKDQPGVHVIYGWMQVSEVIQVNSKDARLKPFKNHPHLHNRDCDSNTIYLSGRKLAIASIKADAAGMFSLLHAGRVLTDRAQSKRSVWRLPRWFHQDSGTTLSYHEQPHRWCASGSNHCTLQSVARGQEFVLTAGDPSLAEKWLAELFDA